MTLSFGHRILPQSVEELLNIFHRNACPRKHWFDLRYVQIDLLASWFQNNCFRWRNIFSGNHSFIFNNFESVPEHGILLYGSDICSFNFGSLKNHQFWGPYFQLSIALITPTFGRRISEHHFFGTSSPGGGVRYLQFFLWKFKSKSRPE